jgi:hypothetical protein
MSAVSVSVSQILPKYNNTESHANTFIFKVSSPNKDQKKYGILYCLLDIREDLNISKPIVSELENLLNNNYHNLSPSMSITDRFERAIEVCNRYLQRLIDNGQISSERLHIAIIAITSSAILISSHGQVNGYYLDNTLGPLAKEKLERIINNNTGDSKENKIFTQIDEIDLSPGMTFAFCSEAVLQLIEEKQLSEALGFQNFDHIIKILAEQFEDSDVSGLINSEQIGLVIIRTNNISSQQIASNSTAFIPKERMVEASQMEDITRSNITRGNKSKNILRGITTFPAMLITNVLSLVKIRTKKPTPANNNIATATNSEPATSVKNSERSKGISHVVSILQKGWRGFYKLFSQNPRLYSFVLIIIILYIIAEIYLF